MVLFSQIACLIIIVLTGFFIFYKKKFKPELRTMIKVSILLAMAFVLSYFSIMLSPSGFPSLKIGFASVPLIFIGLVYGSQYAYLAGLVYDVIGLVVTPTSFPYLGFTLTNVLVCVLPSVIPLKLKEKLSFYLPFILSLVYSLLLIILYYSGLSVQGLTKVSLFVSAILLPLSVLVISYLINRNSDEEERRIFLAVFLVEGFVHLWLNPLWLKIMYDMPYWLSFMPRVVKMPLMMTVDFLILSVMIKVIKKVVK